MYCSIPLEYTIRGDVVVTDVAVDVIIVKGCRIGVRAVVEYVVEYFVLNFVVVFAMYLVSILVVSSCKETCNVLCNNTLVDCAYCYESVFKRCL